MDGDAPILTFPPAEAAALQSAYQSAEVVLEYGAGGSTLVAADLAGRLVFAVESAAAWVTRMEAWFRANPPKARVVLHHGNIGKTRDWGFPVDNRTVARWSSYPVSVWDRPDFEHPDVVLIDGRFRLACALTVLFRITRPLTVLIDDYIDRPSYHEAEPMLGQPEMIGRMARFDVVPGMIPMNRLRLVIDSHMRPL